MQSEKLSARKKKSIRQEQIERFHESIKNAKGRKAKKEARNKLKRLLGKKK